MYNNDKSLSTQAITKQELPKNRAEQTSSYQVDSLKKELNKNLFAKAHSLFYKTLFCSRIKLSNLHTLLLDGVETGVLQSDFAPQLSRKTADFQAFTLL